MAVLSKPTEIVYKFKYSVNLISQDDGQIWKIVKNVEG
jgi:hypothetical protein